MKLAKRRGKKTLQGESFRMNPAYVFEGAVLEWWDCHVERILRLRSGQVNRDSPRNDSWYRSA